jgi:hypothetical protein
MHGCKYGDEDCPVLTGAVLQEFLCESCDNDNFFNFDESCDITMKTIEHKFTLKNRKFKLRKLNETC